MTIPMATTVPRRGPDNSVRVAISGTLAGRNWANVFWCQLTTSSAIAQGDLDTWSTAFANQYKTSFAPRESGSVAYTLVKATCFTPGGSVLHSQAAMTGTGTEAGTDVLYNGVCKVVSWLSTVYWRGGKPRTYLPGVRTVDVDGTTDSTLTNTEKGNVQTAAAGFRTAVNALTQGTITGTTFGFVSFVTGGVVRSPAVFFSFTGAQVHPKLGTQRRRLGKWLN